MNYFFVFQNKTFKEESSGGYLWAPKKNKKGTRVSHWKRMEEVKKGDLIIHSYNTKIAAISIAKEDCKSEKQPIELQKENLWQNDGYKVYVDYIILDHSINTNQHRKKILELQPDEHAPFNKLGRGNTGYLFRLTKELSYYILSKTREVQTDKSILLDIDHVMRKCKLIDNDGCVYDDESLIIATENSNELEGEMPRYLGMPKTKKEVEETRKGLKKYPRDPKTSSNALKIAGHICEYESGHKVFIRKRDGKGYTEPHHLIPLSRHEDFDFSLDVEENIVSLCSHCHNLLHYGCDFEIILKKLYKLRKEKLKEVGLEITYDKLEEYYL